MKKESLAKASPRLVPLVFPAVVILGTTLWAGCGASHPAGPVGEPAKAAGGVEGAPTGIGAEAKPLVPVAASPTTLRAAETMPLGGVMVATRPDWNQGGATTYIVKKGDTLSAIAREHQVKLQSLLLANPELAKNPNVIAVGQRIVIPKGP
jgi:nucleoid-associated protein YgaU